MKRGTALTILARAAEDMVVIQQTIEELQRQITSFEDDEVVRDGQIVDIRDYTAAMRLRTEGVQL